MMRPPSRTALSLLVVAVLVGSCGRSDAPTGPDRQLLIDVPINPALVPSPADAGASPINRIRAVVHAVGDDRVLGETVVSVDPTDDEWVVVVRATVSADGAQGTVRIYLLNASGETETIQFSGEVGPIDLEAGVSIDAPDIPIVRGPLANLFVTGVTITSAPDTLREGDVGALAADAPTSNGVAATVFWTALDSAVLSTDGSTVAGLAPGTGRVVASARSFTDTTSIVVVPAPADVLITPGADTIPSPGGQVTFAGAVVDVRGDTLFTESLLWRSGAPGVATSQGGGVFRGEAPGVAVVRALAASDTTVEGTATLVVEAPPADGTDVALSMIPSTSFPTEGDVVTLSLRVDNLDGPDAETVTGLEIRHSPPDVMTFVDGVTSAGDYDALTETWSIPSLATDASATADLQFRMDPGTGGELLVDSAWVAALEQAQSDLSNDTASVVFEVRRRMVDLEIHKSADRSQPLEGETVTFTVSVINHGPGDVNDLVVFDTLAGVFTAPDHTVSVGALVDSLWTIPFLPEGDTARWTTSTTVAPDVAGGSAANSAILRSIAETDSTPANDTATVAINFPLSAVPEVLITEPADGSVFDPGELATFTATASDAEDGDLTAAIQWSSSIDGALATGASFESDALTTGVHLISAAATDTDDGTGADTITVTIALITAPTTLNVPFGGTASLPITLSEPAPAGGFSVTVTSADPSITTPTASSVFIAGGTTSANATLQGLVPGTTDVTVSNPDFGSATTTVSVTADLNFTAFSIRVPETFPQEVTIRLESEGSPIAAPSGGLDVTLTPIDGACVGAPTTVTIPAGLVQQTATVSAAGVTAPPCTSYLRAEATNVMPDSLNVFVDPTPGINVPATSVGSGLQVGYLQASLGTTAHPGLTFRVESADPSTLLVSPDPTTPGTPFIDVSLLLGAPRVLYYLQGVAGSTGTVRLRISGPGFAPDSADIAVVTPGFRFNGVTTTGVTSLDPEDPFSVSIGVPNVSNSTLQSVQAVRIGGDSVTITLTSSDPAVAEVWTLADSTSPAELRLGPGNSSTQGSVATGGAAFVPLAEGTTTLSGSIPGFVPTDQASFEITVAEPQISVSPSTVGAGLQHGNLIATLEATAHGGRTVLLESDDPSVMLVSPNATTAGEASIEVFVPDGFNRINYYVQGVEGVDDVATLTLSAPGFTTASADVTVVPAGFEIAGLNPSTTSLSPDDPFQIRVGIPFGTPAQGISPLQAVRAGADTLTFLVTSSEPGVGDLVTLPDSASPVTVRIPPSSNSSSTSVAGGGVAFEPTGAGSTDVVATHPTLLQTLFATRTVSVTAPGVSIGNSTVGSGLHYGFLNASLLASDHGGVTVTLESADPSVMLVSTGPADPGAPSVDFALGNGTTLARYFVHGVEGQTGDVYLRMSAPGFTTDSATVSVVQPGVELVGLPLGLTTLSPDEPFQVRVGVPRGGDTGLLIVQSVRADADTLRATITRTNPAVANLVTNTASGASVTVPVPPGSSASPFSLADGGVVLDALGNGTTTISTTIPDYVTQTTGSRDVEITTPTISVPTVTVGAGLQTGPLNAFLAVTSHGGRSVTLTSSNADVFRVSADALTEGTESIVVVVPNGQNRATFYVHGIEGGEATANLLVTASGFTDGSAPVTVVQPAFDLSSLNTSYSAGGSDDPFSARVGIPNATNSALIQSQALRIGAAPITVTFESSDPAAADLITSTETGTPITLTIDPGMFGTPTTTGSGAVRIDPIAPGTTTISALISGFIRTLNGTRLVTINP